MDGSFITFPLEESATEKALTQGQVIRGRSARNSDNHRGSVLDNLDDLIVSLARSRDREAFRTLFDHFAPRLNALFLRMGTDPMMAEEIVQETMVKVWRKSDQFDPAKAKAATWIYTIARNMRVDQLRKEKRPEPDYNDPAFIPDPEPDGLEAVSTAQDADRVRGALADLSEEQREVLKLAFYDEKAHSEIAQELGLPLGTVKSRIRLAFQRIRSGLGEEL